MSQLNSTFVDGQMSLETLWRLLEEQRRQNGSSVASVVGLDEDKLLVENRHRNRHGMTTLGTYFFPKIRIPKTGFRNPDFRSGMANLKKNLN